MLHSSMMGYKIWRNFRERHFLGAWVNSAGCWQDGHYTTYHNNQSYRQEHVQPPEAREGLELSHDLSAAERQ